MIWPERVPRPSSNPDGSDEQFQNCYGPTWGRFKDRTRPAPGNHEYHSRGASGYVRYFGAAADDLKKGYYSYDLGAWHIVVLNSECAEVGRCGARSAQENWYQSKELLITNLNEHVIAPAEAKAKELTRKTP